MASARALDKRRKSVRNIRKITRTMELIATARYRKAMDRAAAATAYTERITQIVARLAAAGTEVRHPLLEPREKIVRAKLLVLSSNRGLCGGYNASVIRAAVLRLREMQEEIPEVSLEISGKRGVNAFRFRGAEASRVYTQFEDQPKFSQVDEIASRYLEEYIGGQIDRLDVVYTKFYNLSKQAPVAETLLPLGAIDGAIDDGGSAAAAEPTAGPGTRALYEFLPSARSVLEEVVPTSFKVRLFKYFLDAAVSEQTARMIAMKSATENAGEMIKTLSSQYNRARQSQITGEIMEIIGGVEAMG